MLSTMFQVIWTMAKVIFVATTTFLVLVTLGHTAYDRIEDKLDSISNSRARKKAKRLRSK